MQYNCIDLSRRNSQLVRLRDRDVGNCYLLSTYRMHVRGYCNIHHLTEWLVALLDQNIIGVNEWPNIDKFVD